MFLDVMINKKFEELVLDLYNKQVSGDYIVDGKFGFTGAVTLWNSTMYFNMINEEGEDGLGFLVKNISDVEKLHIYSSPFDYDEVISKPFFKDYTFKNDCDLLEIKENKNYSFILRE